MIMAEQQPEEQEQRPRRPSWRRRGAAVAAALLLVAAAAIALGLGLRGSRGQSSIVGEAHAPSTITPSTAAIGTDAAAAPVPLEPAKSGGAGAADTNGGVQAQAAPALATKSESSGTKAAAASSTSSQDGLGKLAAVVASAAGGAKNGSEAFKQQQAGRGGAGAGSSSSGGAVAGRCQVWTKEELTAAVEDGPCEQVQLMNPDRDAYALEREINVTRRVSVVGHPVWLPTIDAGGAVRAFRVLAGGYLDLRFVRVRQGGGQMRWRFSTEPAPADAMGSRVQEIRGGGVAIEAGALGGYFFGVTFIAVYNTPEYVASAIQYTLEFTGGRLYGGHVFVMDGDVEFVSCNFWDTTLVLATTDQVVIGGDVLVVGGTCRMLGCTFTLTTGFGNQIGAGFCVAVLGGTLIVTWSFEQSTNVLVTAAGPGQTLFVGGGVCIMTGFDFRLVAAALCFAGVGDFSVMGGVLVMTGVTITNAYALLFAVGAGFYTSVGAGVLVQTGVTYSQQNGPGYNGLAGGSIFVGSGTSINIGCPANFFASVSSFVGMGCFSYNGAGVSVWVGCPYAFYAPSYAFRGAGGVTAQSAGWFTWVGSPVFNPIALQHFAGLGSVLYNGAGAAIIVSSPVYAPIALTFNQGISDNFVVGGRGGAFKKGKGATYADGKHIVSTNANTSRRHLLLGPQTRAGKRWLKDQPPVPYPWAVFDEAEVQGERSTSVLMSETHSFDKMDLNDPALRESLARWVPPSMLAAAEDIQALRADMQALPTPSSAPTPSPTDDEHGRSSDRRRHRRRRRRRHHRRLENEEQEPSASVDATTAAAFESDPVRVNADRATLYVGEEVGYCGACDVDALSGPGAERCETDCTAVQAKLPVGAGANGAFDLSNVRFDPTHLVLATVEATWTDGGDGGAAATGEASRTIAALAMDVRDALRRWLRSPAIDLPDAQVAVYPASPAHGGDELVRRWLRTEETEAEAEDLDPVGRRTATGGPSPPPCQRKPLLLTAAFVAHDANAAALLQAATASPEQQQEEEEEGQAPSSLEGAAEARASMLEALGGALPTDACGDSMSTSGSSSKDGSRVSVAFARAFFVPAYDSPDFLQQQQQQQQQQQSKSSSGVAINDIRLVDPLRPGIPLGGQQVLVRGRAYRLDLAGFAPEATLDVTLMPAPEGAEEEQQQQQQQPPAPRRLTTLSMDERGAGRMLWTVPRSLPLGAYYLEASAAGDAGGAGVGLGLSPLYSVAARPARRRLFGPVLEI